MQNLEIQIDSSVLMQKVRQQAGELAQRDLVVEQLARRVQQLEQANRDLSAAFSGDENGTVDQPD